MCFQRNTRYIILIIISCFAINRRREKGIECNLDEIMAEISYRDEQDSNRPVAPLKPAPDSVVFDNSDYNFEQSVDFLYNIIKEKC